jgi:hypothetical protein
MKIYRDKTISDQTFVLEDTSFYDCTLKNCDLFFSGGDVEISNVKLDGSRLHFRGAAKNTTSLMVVLRMIPGPTQLPPQVQSGSTKLN